MILNERKFTPQELEQRAELINKLKKNKHSLVQRYGKDAEKVMYGRASNIIKKRTMDENFKLRLKEAVYKALKNIK